MNDIFVSPEPMSAKSVHVVGDMEEAMYVGAFPLAILKPAIVKGGKTVVSTATRTVTSTIFSGSAVV